MLFNTTVAVLATGGDFTRLMGNPTLTSLDGETRAPLRTILADSWSSEDRAAFGVFLVDTSPPEGKRWTGALEDDDGVPVPVFEDVQITSAHVDAERDRRIAAGFEFVGKLYQSRPEDRENIAGASIAALAAMGAGAQPDDLRWHGGDSDCVWIAADNSLTPMDAQTMFAFGQAAMAHKQAHIFAARAVKDAEPIPADYADDGYWPGGAA